MEYLDRLAEGAVKKAFQNFAASGKRAYSHSLPPEARILMLKDGRGRLSPSDADRRVQQAIQRLRERKEIKAPVTPHSEWGLIAHSQPASEGASDTSSS